MFIPRAQPHAQSLFLFPIVFGINLIHFFNFFDEKKNGAAGSFALLLRSPVTPFDSAKNANCNVWGPGDGPLEMYFEKTRTRRRKREKDSERYSPESGHIRKRYGDWREYLVVR